MASNRQHSNKKKLLLSDTVSAVVTDTDESISDLEKSISDGTDEYLPSETESGDNMMGTGHQNDDIGRFQ